MNSNVAAGKIRVFHLEDYKIMRDGIKLLLSQDSEIEIVGEGQRAEDLFKALEIQDIDVLILDIYLDRMEDLETMNGFTVCRIMSEKYPRVKIVVHSAYDDADRVAKIFKTGALGFVSKKSGFDELINAIKSVYRGRRFLCIETSGRLKNLNKFLAGIEDNLKSKDELFSHREREVLELLSMGMSSKEIADKLFITERTVESHRKNMIEKGNAKNTVELIAYASSLGLLKK